jgi:two-component system, cell cycle sensor histidine kinase and response regulator CckA
MRDDNRDLALAAIIDVDERKRLDMEMWQKQKLESLGIMAGGVAHDFNNLLTVVLGKANLALQELPPYSPSYGQVEQIIRAGREAADLTRQLLAYAGKGQFYITDIGLPFSIA